MRDRDDLEKIWFDVVAADRSLNDEPGLRTEFGRLLALTPDGCPWAVETDGAGGVAVLLLSDRTLFCAPVSRASLSLASEQIDAEKMVVHVRLADIDPRGGEPPLRHNEWTFAVRPGATLRKITGSAKATDGDTDEVDRRESFARRLASIAGWQQDVPEPSVELF